MEYKLTSFRCPEALLERIDRVASAAHSSRTHILLEALRVFIHEINLRGGNVVPPLSAQEKKKLFPDSPHAAQNSPSDPSDPNA